MHLKVENQNKYFLLGENMYNEVYTYDLIQTTQTLWQLAQSQWHKQLHIL
jgi:hypothetical protein